MIVCFTNWKAEKVEQVQLPIIVLADAIRGCHANLRTSEPEPSAPSLTQSEPRGERSRGPAEAHASIQEEPQRVGTMNP